jgi:hypothetical protein
MENGNKDIIAECARTRKVYGRLRLLVILSVFFACGIVTFIDICNKVGTGDTNPKDLDSQIAAIKAGRTHSIRFCNTVATDLSLPQIVGMEEIEQVIFESTDVTGKGLLTLTSMKNLKSVEIKGSNPVVPSDQQAIRQAIGEVQKVLPNCVIKYEAKRDDEK